MFSKTIVGLLVLVVISTRHVNSQECITPRNTTGQCLFINQCQIILNLMQHNTITNIQMKNYLQQYTCGHDAHYPKVCCETDAGPCNLPDHNPGVCVPIKRCNSLLKLLDTKPFLSDTSVDYLRKSECHFGNNARVCCPLKEKTSEPIRERKKERLPQPGECGVEELQDKIWGGNKTGLSEFPWMVLLEYGSYNDPTLACGGSLISERFVLTAAHCVTGPEVARFGNLQRIRLGEYDINNTTDCVNKLEYVDCSDPIQRIDVAKIIAHKEFDLRNRNRVNDIALVQMKQVAKYTEFIRPICLPPPYYIFPDQFHVAGWGRTEKFTNSNVKLKLQLPFFNHADCKAIYSGLRFPVHLGRGQICAGGVKGKDSCTGDSGGPLMAMERHPKFGGVWFQAGVVSFGPTPCGQNQPGVYTNVLEYLPWVHKTVTNTEV